MTDEEKLAAIKSIFDGYVFGSMRADIGREIHLAKLEGEAKAILGQYEGGGNFLAALGLMCYTEFLGSFVTGKKGFGQSRPNGEAFLKRLGDCYEDELAKEPKLWDIFRNGLAHEYFVKKNCAIYMVKGAESCGVGKMDDRYYFVVERYFDDLMVAAEHLYEELQANPLLPAE